ncbi:Sialic acid TRAP transporter permease protein SiaT [subsurface metagenome]
MEIGWITILLFGSMLLLLLTGLPVVWSLGGIGTLFALFLWGPESLVMALFGVKQVMDYGNTMVCIPMFVFMGMMLHQSGVIDKFYEAALKWLDFLPGSLATVTIGVCAVMAAMVGEVTPATLTMGTTALPSMLDKKYNKNIAIGCIQAGAALGFLIPPSVIAVLYAIVARASIGKFFAGGLIPGLMLATMFIIYITVRCYLQPQLAPRISRQENISWGEKISSLRAVIAPAFVVIMVLGSILLGLCSPVEASAMGAMTGIIVAALSGRLPWQVLKNALTYTLKLTIVALWIFIAALAFGKVYRVLGAPELIQGVLDLAPGGALGVLIMIQLSYFFLGMVLDDTAILFICLPLYLPIAISLGFDRVWFGVLYLINMQMAFLTPPFGYCLFLMKSVAPKGVTMGDIYRSVWPFVIIQGVGLILCIIFPDLVLWFPNLLFGK